MELRIIAAASLVAFAAQGCYRPMYAPPYGYSSQGYPIGNGYPGSIQTTVPSQPYAPGTTMPMGTQPGGVPTYGNPPTYSPPSGVPSANSVPVPIYKDAQQFQAPDTAGSKELGFAPPGGGLLQTAGTASTLAQPNPFAAADAQPLAQPTFAEQSPTRATVTSDNFVGGDSPTRLQ